MQVKSGPEVEIAIRELRARNTVLETILTQLMVRVAARADQPQEFVRVVMMDAEENLRRAANQAAGNEKAIADDAMQVFANYSMRLIAGMTPKGKRPQ